LFSLHFTPSETDNSPFNNENDKNQCIECGFQTSSIENILKYDVIYDLIVSFYLFYEVKWSHFEWSYEPDHLDLLCFAFL